jgi:hypothetical protein
MLYFTFPFLNLSIIFSYEKVKTIIIIIIIITMQSNLIITKSLVDNL